MPFFAFFFPPRSSAAIASPAPHSATRPHRGDTRSRHRHYAPAGVPGTDLRPRIRSPVDVQGEPFGSWPRGRRSPAVRGPVRLFGGRREPAEPAQGRTSAHLVVQQVRRVVRGTRRQWPRGMGAIELCDTGELPGEALLVPRTHLPQCCRVFAQLRDQWQFPGARKRELARPKKY